MAEGGFDYDYKNRRPNDDLSHWPVTLATSSFRLIGQPTVTWDNLGPLFLKHKYYGHVIEPLLAPDRYLYNVIQFCENNPNCVEIEIDKKKQPDSSKPWYSGHHIFASCPVDLTKLIDSQFVTDASADNKVNVKWIHNCEPEQDTTLDAFLTTLRGLQTDQGCGIFYKYQSDQRDNFEEYKHLSFILELRRYCGDISGLNHDPDTIETREELTEYVKQFHKSYVEPNAPPSQQIVCTFLQTLKSKYNYCQLSDKNLNWDSVKKWEMKLEPLITLFNQVLPDFKFQRPETPTTDLTKTAMEQFQLMNVNKFTALLADKLKSTEYTFVFPSDAGCPLSEHIGSIVYQFKAFLEKKHFVQNAARLIEQIQSLSVDDHIIFAIYGKLIASEIIQDLKNPDSKTINILSFLIENVQKDAVIGSLLVPDLSEVKNRVIIVVNNIQETDQDVKQLLFNFLKDKDLPKLFINSRFSVMLGNEIHKDLGLVEAFNLFKTIVTEENVDRIDGEVVRERVVRATAAETWTEGVTAATKFILLSQVFLRRYYDNENYKNLLKNDSKQQIKELIQKTTEMLTALRENLDTPSVNDLKHKIEHLTPLLFRLFTNLELTLPLMPEGIELHSAALKELNQILSSLIESEKVPKRSSKETQYMCL